MNNGSPSSPVERGFEVAERHREVLQRLHRIVQTLTCKVEGILEGNEPCVCVPVKNPRGEAGSEKVSFDVLGERDSVTDAIVKLTGVLAKLIALERQAYYLESSVDPQDLTDEQLLRLLGRHSRPGGVF